MRGRKTGRQGDGATGRQEDYIGISDSPCLFVAPSPHHPVAPSSVHSCHHPWTAMMKLITSCGHILVPIYHVTSLIDGISSAISVFSALLLCIVLRWHGHCFIIRRRKERM